MAFTLKWLLPPIIFVALVAYTESAVHKNYAPLYLLFFIWFGFAMLVVVCYWIGRAFRRGSNEIDRSYPRAADQWRPPR